MPDDPRARLAARLIAARRGGPPPQGELSLRAAEACVDATYVERIVEGLVASGLVNPTPDDPLAPCCVLEELPALDCFAELESRLDLRLLRVRSSLERIRLGRLYGLIGLEEKGAQCLRECLAAAEPLPLDLSLDLATAAQRGGARSLALAALDWVAESLVTFDEVSEGPPSRDPVRNDPRALALLLGRARDLALNLNEPGRAVVLGRIALAVFEQISLEDDARVAHEALIRALARAGDPQRALLQAKRLRQDAREQLDGPAEGAAIALAAELLAEAGNPKGAGELRREAAKAYREAGCAAEAVAQLQVLATLLEHRGQATRAQKTLEAAAEEAHAAGLREPGLELSARRVRADLRAGRIGAAIQRAEALRRGWTELERPARVAEAVVLLAWALAHAGALAKARQALARAPESEDWATAARSLRLRAELALQEERKQEGRLLLRDAARAFVAAEQTLAAAEARLRLAESYQDGAEPAEAAGELARYRASPVAGRDPALELRAELLAARQAEDPDEREILLDEVHDRASQGGRLPELARSAHAKARAHLAAGDVSLAQEVLRPVLKELLRIRRELPESLQKGFARSPLAGPILELAKDPALSA